MSTLVISPLTVTETQTQHLRAGLTLLEERGGQKMRCLVIQMQNLALVLSQLLIASRTLLCSSSKWEYE